MAAGLCAAATASDGAGSIRIPASVCGLVGLKPQRDRIAADAGRSLVRAQRRRLLTRTVADTALMLDVAAQAAARAPVRRGRGAPAAAAADRDLAEDAVPARAGRRRRCAAAIEAVAERLRALGHEVVEHDPHYGRATDALIPRYLRGIAQDADAMPRPERLQRRTRGFARIGRLFPEAARASAPSTTRPRHAARLGELFGDYDLLLTPVSTRPPVGATEWEGLGAARTLLGMSRVYPFTGIWNMTGQPAISIPAPPAAACRSAPS